LWLQIKQQVKPHRNHGLKCLECFLILERLTIHFAQITPVNQKHHYPSSVKQLSVVTITFHDSDGLKKTRDSLALDLVNWIVIDGSTDKESIAQNQKILKNVNCEFVQEQDRGRFDAMNKGLGLVKTELVTFLNSGDMHASLKVPRQIISSYKTHGWDWAVGQTVCVDHDGKELWNWPMPDASSLKFKLSIRSFSHQATVYKSQFLREMGGYYPNSLYSDWILSLRMSRHVRPYIHSKIWCHFLGGGISANQTVVYWSKECIKLRRMFGMQVGGNPIIDFLSQHSAALLIKLDRGKMLMRPDLAQKYKAKNHK